MTDEIKTAPQMLAWQILQQQATKSTDSFVRGRLNVPETMTVADASSVETLVALYFACEDADERDIVFERLTLLDFEQTQAFFVAMMLEDADEFMRVAAASVLVKQGDAAAADVLMAQLHSGGDVILFEQALAGLLLAPDPNLYTTLIKIWQDDARESAERRAAMLGMEQLEPQLASAAMVNFIDGLNPQGRFADDQLEVAMAMLARQPHNNAIAALERLAARVAAVPAADIDAQEDRKELLGFVHEGLALVRSALAPT